MKTNLLRNVLGFVVGILISYCHAGSLPKGDPSGVGMSAERLDRLTKVFMHRVEEKKLPGVVINVARNGKLIYSEAIGWQDLETDTPMSSDSIFRIYSMTKPIVSVAAMTLVESGKLSMLDPVSKFIPAFKDTPVGIDIVDQKGKAKLETRKPKKPITIHDLLRHTSGITYGNFGTKTMVKEAYLSANLRSTDWHTLEDWVNKIAELPLMYEPGSTWEYGRSTDVLGRVIEVAAETTLDEYLAATIFEPLNMSDTSFGVPPQKHYRIAEPMPNIPVDKRINLIDVRKPMTLFSGGSGLSSTAGDYSRFCQMLLNGGELDGVRILSPTTVRYMSSNHLNGNISKGELYPYIPGPGYGFGLGFGTRLENGQSVWPGTKGEYFWAGYGGTYFWIDPEEKLVVSFMSQDPYTRNEHRVLIRNLVYQAIID